MSQPEASGTTLIRTSSADSLFDESPPSSQDAAPPQPPYTLMLPGAPGAISPPSSQTTLVRTWSQKSGVDGEDDEYIPSSQDSTWSDYVIVHGGTVNYDSEETATPTPSQSFISSNATLGDSALTPAPAPAGDSKSTLDHISNWASTVIAENGDFQREFTPPRNDHGELPPTLPYQQNERDQSPPAQPGGEPAWVQERHLGTQSRSLAPTQPWQSEDDDDDLFMQEGCIHISSQSTDSTDLSDSDEDTETEMDTSESVKDHSIRKICNVGK